MPVLSLDKVSIGFGHSPLLDGADLQLEAGERVGLIGRNGGGKSTLLRLVAGLLQPEAGKLWRAPGVSVGYVAQEPQLDPAHTVFEAVAEGLGAARRLLLEYHELARRLGQGGEPMEPLLGRMHELRVALDAQSGWRVETRVENLMTRLALPADRQVAELSGGWRKRVALARALVAEPDLLLLDEPTNHLDLAAIQWLEQMLAESAVTLLLVTHDRRFLDRVARRIVELDRGRLTTFPGNFTAYQRQKQALLEVEATQGAKQDKVLAREEAWIRQGIKARRTRNEGRVRRLEALRRERAARRERLGTVSMALDQAERSGTLVAELTGVTKSFAEQTVIRDFSTRVLRGDRIGIIGPNGAGKTTLLRLILGELAPDAGTVRQGSKLSIAYFDQLREQLDEEATLADTIAGGAELIDVGGKRKHVLSYLGDFLFPPEQARAPIKALSGGERNRLLLARLFVHPANVLVLDEPTNDLDIETLELLEALLQDFAGTMLLVSHDRAFLDNVVTQLIAFEGDGRWREHAGGYDDWERVRSAEATAAVPTRETPPKAAPAPRAARAASSHVKLSFKEARELESLPAELEALELEQAEITARLGQPELYRGNPGEVSRLRSRFAAIDAALAAGLERWEALEAKLEASQR